MTKQEKIKEAWGGYWDALTEKAQDRALRSDGYVFHHDLAGELLRGQGNISLQFKKINQSTVDICRPQSLEGFETNNGWIRIESEEDLPKSEDELFETGIFGESGDFIQDRKRHARKTIKWMFERGLATHYKPVQVSKPPIY